MLELVKNMNARTQSLIAIILTVGVLFGYTVHERSSWFGEMNQGLWVTASTLKFSRNWFRNGAINDSFLMLERPKSIESEQIKDRRSYLSYPSGSILQIHLIAKILNTEPSLALVMTYNLFSHFAIALIFAFIGFLTASHLKLRMAFRFIFSVMPASFYLLAPFPMAYHLIFFYADEAVLLPFALVILIEIVFSTTDVSPRARLMLTVIQHLLFALGLFTDYLFFLVYGLFYIKRLCLGQMGTTVWGFLGRSAVFSLPFLVSVGGFLCQIYHCDAFTYIKDKFLFRTGSNQAGQKYVTDFYAQFWEKQVATDALGKLGVSLIFISAFMISILILIILIKKSRKKLYFSKTGISLLCISAIITYSCIGQVYLLDNHSINHRFSALKMAFLLAIVPFGILPMSIAALSDKAKSLIFGNRLELRFLYFKGKIIPIPLFVFCTVFIFLPYVGSIYPNFRPLIDRKPTRSEEFGNFLDQHTGYNDVVFSNTVRIAANPPETISLSMKLVYKVRELRRIEKQIRPLPERAIINVLVDKKKNRQAQPIGGTDFWKNSQKISSENLEIYKLTKPEFIQRLKKRLKKNQLQPRA
ncbi:MAG: hypothetical protein QNJ97_16090 [Myxococcota bacterium]|nr:hypothetical protein [Myxococcota bacterium]